MEDVENLWANFVLEAIGAGEKHQSEMADDYSHLAAETLDVWLWAAATGGVANVRSAMCSMTSHRLCRARNRHCNPRWAPCSTEGAADEQPNHPRGG